MMVTLVQNDGSTYNHREIDNGFIVNNTFESEVGKRQRPPIPESVRSEFWRRDLGKCVACDSQINLEFDPFIPFS